MERGSFPYHENTGSGAGLNLDRESDLSSELCLVMATLGAGTISGMQKQHLPLALGGYRKLKVFQGQSEIGEKAGGGRPVDSLVVDGQA